MPPSPSIAAATRDEWLVPPPLVAEAGQAGSVNEQAGANQGPVEGPQGGLNGQEEVLERHEEFIWAQEWDTMAQAEPEKATMVLGMDEYRVGLEEIAGIEQPASSESARYSVLVDWYGGLGSEVDAPASPSPAPAPAPVSVPAPSMFAWRISVPAAVAAPAPRPPRRNYPAQQQIAGKKRKAVEDMGAASKKQCLVSLASRISGYGMKRKGESSWEESSPQGAFLPADLDRRRKANLVKVTCLINTHLPCIHENEKQHDRAKADHTRVQGISEADKSKQLNSGPRLHLGASGSQEKVVEAQNKPKTAANGLQMGGMSGDTPISKRLRSRSVAPVVHSDNKENQVPQVKGRPVKAMVPATPAPAPGVPAPVRRQTRAMALKAQEQVPKKMDGSPIDLRSRRK